MHDQRLLERIRERELNPDHRGEGDPRTLIESVMGHLMHILNTRQGSAQIAEDYGVPDFTDFGSSFTEETIPEVERAIDEVIRKYEPRLSGIRVTYEPQAQNPLALTFRLEASVKMGERVIPVVFETILDADGKISVKN